jgi:hypothetical protein
MARKDTLIIQFRKGRGSDLEYEQLIAFEDSLIQGYAQNGAAVVDGHDSGGGTMNIFIWPRGSWKASIAIAVQYLKLKQLLDQVVVIKRLKSEKYEVVWPKGYTGEFERI